MKTESVWDYPRPAICEPVPFTLKVFTGERILANTQRGYRVLETSHPPTYYFPPEDVDMALLQPNEHHSHCEWKGRAKYYDLLSHGGSGHQRHCVVGNVAWSYGNPTPGFAPLKNFLCFYPSRVSACYVGDHKVLPQEGDFYGGWITPNLKGPFKGAPGTMRW